MNLRKFSIYGLIAEISVDKQVVLDLITSALKTYDMFLIQDPPGESHLSIHLETASESLSIPPEYQLVDKIGCLDIMVYQSQFLVSDGFSIIELDSEKNKATGILNVDMWSDTAITHSENLGVLMYSIAVLLGFNNLFLLHSAGLVHQESGYLFLGHSGSGKTTTTLGLIANGWHVLSDDTILVQSHQESVEAISFRKDLYLKEDTVEKFPWTNHLCEPARLPTRNKKRVMIKELCKDQFRNSCFPRHLIFLSVIDAEKSVLSKLTKTAAFFSLLEQCPFISIDAKFASLHMECLRILLNQSSWYQLYLGQDLKDNPCRIADLLKPVECENYELSNP